MGPTDDMPGRGAQIVMREQLDTCMIYGVENYASPQETTVGVIVGEVGPLNGCMSGGFLEEACLQLL